MKHKELKVGVFAAVALGLLYFGFNFLKGVDFFERKKIYYAVYENINQLTKSNPVLINGYAVGRVSRTKILQKRNNDILVELEIDADIILTKDTKAVLNSEFLGSKYLLLEIGNSPVRLKPGDTLKTEVARGMFDVLSESAEPVANDLQTTLRKFNMAVSDLTRIFTKVDVILTKLQTTPDLLNKTLVTTNGRIDELSASLKQDAEKTGALLDELKPVIANFKTISDSL
ncbi:MAG: MCE family protein, partial [Bacteroidetes bacterium]|nr:MCE family protein [Bacteroidota bacterium]